MFPYPPESEKIFQGSLEHIFEVQHVTFTVMMKGDSVVTLPLKMVHSLQKI